MMSDSQLEVRNSELKCKRICRFCLSQEENVLTNMYSRENRLKSSAPLPLQVMACVSIEVFTNDGMPSTVCDNCRMLMEHCYRFKQMCKKADTALRQFPLTGIWPTPLDLPKIPAELIPLQQQPHTIRNSIPLAKPSSATVLQKRRLGKSPSPVPQPISIIKTSPRSPGRPKILNKSSVKILNKSVEASKEPILSKPIIKRNDAGNVEIVTEILEQVVSYEEPDPIKTAAPVETNVFPCPHCERSFPLRQLLDIHMVNHNRERSFECEVCEKRFFSKYDLGKHMFIHTGEKPFECVVCKKAFTRSTLLYRHEKIHTDQPKFLCVYCEKPFLSKDELEKHTERHRKKRPFACKVCGKCFAFKQGLERHETIHAKDQPFPCQYCNLSFSTPSKLSRHLTAHAGDRPFPCKLCPKSYLLSHHLTRHLRSHALGSGSYKCYDCEKAFTNRDDLIYHSAVHATQTLVCPLCKERFRDLDTVTEHIKQHAEGEQYACEFCDLIFMTADKLQSHSDSQHSEDLAVYDEHTRNNVKKENRIQYTDGSQDGNEEGEVIQEFIIEEYSNENDEQIIEEVTQYVKEENELISGDNEVAVKPNSLRSTRLKRKPVQPPKSNVNTKKRVVKEVEKAYYTDDDSADMEIETLEKDVDYELEFEEDDDDDEPATKTIKVSTRGKIVSNVDKDIVKQKKQTSKQEILTLKKDEKPIISTSGKLRQTTLTSVLQQLPKGVTIIKKENTATIPDKASPETKEIRVLNQRIIKKPKVTSPEQVLVPAKSSKEISKPAEIKQRKSSPATENKIASAQNNAKTKSSPKQGNSSLTSTSNQKNKPEAQQTSKPLSGVVQNQKLVEMMIGDRKVKVQKIMMTKAEVAAMAKEGKIEMKGGTMILKQDKTPSAKGMAKKSDK